MIEDALNAPLLFFFILEPLSGPDVSITTVGETQVLIQWDELAQEKQRGFITNYTIYFQRHRDKRLIRNRK